MKKLFSALILVIAALALSTAAFADIAPYPRHETLNSWILPVILVIVIIAVVILVKVLRGRKK